MSGYIERTIVSVGEILRGDLYRTAYVHHLECGHEFEREVKMEGTLLCPSCRPAATPSAPPPVGVDSIHPRFSPPSKRWKGWLWHYVPGCVAADFNSICSQERDPLDCWLGTHDKNPPCFIVIWSEGADGPDVNAKEATWQSYGASSGRATAAHAKAVAAGVLL